MSRIEKAFLKGKAVIPFVMCGDTDLTTSEKLILKVAESADLVLLGIPFSDPTAQGDAVTLANQRALNCGTTCDKVFSLVEKLRKKTDIPFAFKTFANIVFSRGIDNFFKQAAKLKVGALILPDVPKEESGEFASAGEKYGINVISTVTLTSGDRIEKICKGAKGFVYCDLNCGDGFSDDEGVSLIKAVKAATDIPCVVATDINGSAAERYLKAADGIVLENSVAEIVEKYAQNSVPYVDDFLKQIKRRIK